MEICHCVIITSIQGLPLYELITTLPAVENDAPHTQMYPVFLSPVVSLQWFPVYTWVCRAGFNLSSAAVLGSSSTQWGLCSSWCHSWDLRACSVYSSALQRQQGYIWLQSLRLVVIKAHNNKTVVHVWGKKTTHNASNCAEGSESGGHSRRIVNHDLSSSVCLYSLDTLAKYGHVLTLALSFLSGVCDCWILCNKTYLTLKEFGVREFYIFSSFWRWTKNRVISSPEFLEKCIFRLYPWSQAPSWSELESRSFPKERI